MKFRKKPVVIEAVQFNGQNHDEIVRFVGEKSRIMGREKALGIVTLEGVMWASPDDWIIRGVQGEFYPCKPDIFTQTYEPAGEEV